MELLEITKESFKELFQVLKNNRSTIQKYAITFVGFLVTFAILIVLSKLLPQISFLENIDLADPNNVAAIQPKTDLQSRIYFTGGLIFFFVFITVVIGRRQGFGSILALILSGFTIFNIVIPLILQGWDPTTVTLVFGSIILIVSVLLSHGLNTKTITSLTSGILTLFLTMFLAELFRIGMYVSGYNGENVYNLLAFTQVDYNIPGIILSSVVLAGLGLLDDITLTQTSVTVEIHNTDKKLSMRELYGKAMNVGRDHLGALVNSLFYAYAAASLPLLLILSYSQIDFDTLVKQEYIIEEILRTLIASIGLILSIPLSTFIAAFVLKRQILDIESDGEGHVH